MKNKNNSFDNMHILMDNTKTYAKKLHKYTHDHK